MIPALLFTLRGDGDETRSFLGVCGGFVAVASVATDKGTR